jgi:putative flippase GtrA
MNRKFIVQAFRYGIVGVMNTLLTAVIIWLMMRIVFHVKGGQDASSTAVSVSNITGYIAGLINSFVWNRRWTFQSRKHWRTDFLKFILAFLICYIPQLLLVMLLNSYVAGLSAYICQIIGIVFYTALNFLCNKYYTFNEKAN